MAAYKSATHKFYVHYHALSYLKDHQAKNFPFYTYAQAKAQQLANDNSLSSGLSKQQKENYLSAINALMGRTAISSNLDPKLVEYEQQRLENIMQQKLKNELAYDKVSGKVTKIMTTKNLNLSNQEIHKNTQKEAISDTRLEQLLQSVNKIKKSVIQDIQDGVVDLSKTISVEELNEIEIRIQGMINAAEDLIKKDAAGNNIGYLKPYAAAHKTKRWYLRSDEEAAWLQEIDSLVKQYKASVQTATKIQGDYFEEVAAAAARVCVGTTEKYVVDNITGMTKDFVGQAIGGIKEQMGFRLDGMHLASYDRVFNNMVSQQKIITDKQGNRYMILENYSQGKVDVKAYFPIETKINNRKLQPIKISAKSYSDLSSLGAVNGISLWTFLQNENSYFIKAYLNTMANHMAILEQRAWSDTYEARSIKTILAQKELAVSSMKILAAYRALTGDTLGRSKAQVFLINDATNKRIHLLEMADIFNYILLEIKVNKTAIDKYFNFNKTLDILDTYNNSWHPSGADARMGDLIQEVHAHKLSIIFKPKAILTNSQITITR